MLIILAKANSYRKDGKIVLVYTVGSNAQKPADQKAEIEAFEKSQGEYLRKNEAGEPLYFSQRVCVPGDELKQTKSGRFQVLSGDLEQEVVAKEEAIEASANKYLGQLRALNITPAQMRARMLADL